jgi:hypothetical protein
MGNERQWRHQGPLQCCRAGWFVDLFLFTQKHDYLNEFLLAFFTGSIREVC